MVEHLSPEYKDLLQVARDRAQVYGAGSPFPNTAFHNVFDPEFLDRILAEFPDLSKEDAQKYENQKEIKLAGKGERFFGDETKKLMHFLNSEYFLNFLQILTGIKEPLFGDPYFNGGGQHETKPGGLLKVHADFNRHPISDLDRRINVLVYLNKDWKEEYGGHFELWDKEMENCEKKILPTFNTMAIFSTTDFSYHGHPNPLSCPEGMSRKSLALYYYSNGRPKSEINPEIGKHTTIFKERKNSAMDREAFSQHDKMTFKRFVKGMTPPFIWNALRGMRK